MLDFFQPTNLFNWRTNFSSSFLIWEIFIFSILFILFFIFKITLLKKSKAYKSYKILSDKISSFLSTCAILGFVIIFCQWQNILFLSAPILLVILFIIFIVWFIIILRFYLKNFKILYKQEKQNKVFKKYLPDKN